MKIKMLDFIPFYPPHIGGLEKYAEELHQNLSRKNVDITVFAPNLPETMEFEKKKGIKIIRYPAFEIIHNYPLPKFWKAKFWRMYLNLFKKDYDITFSVTRFFATCLLAFFYSKKKNVPWIHIEHGSDFVQNENKFISWTARMYDETLGRMILKTSNLNIAPSKSAAKFINLFTPKPSITIYRGMPFDYLEKIKPNKEISKRYPNKKIITYLGRFISGKGVADLIKAISKIKRDDFMLLLVGYGEEEKTLKKITKKLGLEDKISFEGSKNFDEAIAILKSTDIFINPSYNEGLPTTILEAGVCKCGIIATDVGGTREIIQNNISGILIKPQKIKLLSDKIKNLLDNEKERVNLGKNAHKDIKKKFNWEVSTNKYIKEINALCK